MLFNYGFVIDIVCFVVITFGNIVIFSYDLEMFFLFFWKCSFFMFTYFIFFKKRCLHWSYFFPFFSLKFFRTDIEGNVDIGDLTWEQKEKGDRGWRWKNSEVQEIRTDRVHKGDNAFRPSDNKVEWAWGFEERRGREWKHRQHEDPQCQSWVRPTAEGAVQVSYLMQHLWRCRQHHLFLAES